jgi:hypothetical protein
MADGAVSQVDDQGDRKPSAAVNNPAVSMPLHQLHAKRLSVAALPPDVMGRRFE